MIETYTQEFREDLVEHYLSKDLVAFLIHLPSLGITDTPTSNQLEQRKLLTMMAASAAEIEVQHGYKRSLVAVTAYPPLNPYQTIYDLTSTFTAAANGDFPEATHICYACGVNLTNPTNGNGNHRGDTQGTLIKVEPLFNAPLTIRAGVTFTHSTSFKITSQIAG